MCAIFGWNSQLPKSVIDHIVTNATHRGRDGWGFWIDGLEHRGVGEIPESVMKGLYYSRRVVGNFRATPTTESETEVQHLQPYRGIVHNGVIANDKQFGDFKIDSQCLPQIFFETLTKEQLVQQSMTIEGSYALAFFGPRDRPLAQENDLYLACNYKPIFVHHIGFQTIFASQPYMIPDERVIAMKPYSARIYRANGKMEEMELPRSQNQRVAIAASAGLDSTTVAYQLKSEGYDVTLIHFKYGCNAEKHESERICKIAEDGLFNLEFIDMPKSALGGTIVNGDYNTEGGGVAGAEYAKDWVSARNLLMLSILTAYAETNNIGFIAFGGNLEESGAYPDNEEEFGRRFNELLPFATQNGVKIELLQPVARLMKHEIVKIGLDNHVPYELTWSCYGDGEEHCGQCGPCFMRREAFMRNAAKDPAFK